jgi:exodeoxyribonuclease V alpha subunit
MKYDESVAREPQTQLDLPRAGHGPAPANVLEGEVVRVTYENERSGFRVLRVRVEGKSEPQTVVGVFPAAPPGTRVRATGRRVDDPKHGEQFQADTLLTVAPSTLEGLKRYLGSGLVPGIGPAYAARIVDTFGERTLEVLDREPHRLREVSGLGKQRAGALASAWSQHRDIGAIMVFLQSHGASPALAARIYKRFGPKALHVVSRSPYRLALDVWGIGFKTADAIARSIGVDENAPERAQAGVLHVLHEVAGRGHVFAPRAELVDQGCQLLGSAPPAVEQAIETLAGVGRVVLDDRVPGVAVYTPEMHAAELRVAARLGALSGKPPVLDKVAFALADFEKRSHLSLGDEQRHAVATVAHHQLVVITGGPGVGKTTLVLALLALFDVNRLRVRLAAPTGRAAKRMSEATGRDAATLHRMLEFDPSSGAFKRKRDNPLDADVVIVDESSMLALELADALTDALRNDTRLVLVGDVDQLPSVGPGAILRDVIDSGRVATVRLTQIFRQAEGSSIVENAHRIHRGERPLGAAAPGEQFYVLDRRTPDSAIHLIEELIVERIPQGFALDPLNDIQVLTPMQRGPVGAIALNELLQRRLNPEGPEVRKGSRILRLGDKVMQLRNDYEKEVFNGDVGRITSVDAAERRLVVHFDGRAVPYVDADLDELTLAYATSIHKSQGSEYPAVIVPVLTQHFVMLSRNLIYTAVTRAKRLVVMVTDPRALTIALAAERREERRTALARRIAEAQPDG